MKNILVTGGNGFIGRRLCCILKQSGLRVITLSRRQNKEDFYNFQIDLTADELPPDLFEGIDTVFHLAGKAHALSENLQDPIDYRLINTLATRKVLQAAQQAGVKKFIFFSSVKAVGDGNELKVDESFDVLPDTPYGQSKREAEQLVLHGGYVPHPVVIRPCMVYGNTDKGNMPRMIKAIRKGIFPPLPENHNKRSMVHVDDVVRAAMLAADNPKAAGQIYIVSDGQAYSTRQIYNWIREALDKPASNHSVPMFVLQAAAGIGDLFGRVSGSRFPIDSDALQKLTASAWYSSDKITEELGFVPQHTLKESLPEIIRYLG